MRKPVITPRPYKGLSFKQAAFRILKEAGEPLHINEITKRAIQGGIKTRNNFPELTMYAKLNADIEIHGKQSRFTRGKSRASEFGSSKSSRYTPVSEQTIQEITKQQQASIAEARIAELIMLYSNTALSCYKTIENDNSTSMIVKNKTTGQTTSITIKSRFATTPNGTYTQTENNSKTPNNAAIFCFFDTTTGELAEYLWFIPYKEAKKMGNTITKIALGIIAGKPNNSEKKWKKYLIDRKELANRIQQHMDQTTASTTTNNKTKPTTKKQPKEQPKEQS